MNGQSVYIIDFSNPQIKIKLYVVVYRKVNGKYKKIAKTILAHIVENGSN